MLVQNCRFVLPQKSTNYLEPLPLNIISLLNDEVNFYFQNAREKEGYISKAAEWVVKSKVYIAEWIKRYAQESQPYTVDAIIPELLSAIKTDHSALIVEVLDKLLIISKQNFYLQS